MAWAVSFLDKAMAKSSNGFYWIAWGVLAAVLIAIGGLFIRQVSSRSSLPEYAQVQAFTLTNQAGATFTRENLLGKVWVADVIFTRCAGPCPRMTEEMSKLAAAFGNEKQLEFVTLTTDPEYDTPAVLKKYGERFGAREGQWHFLTGSKSELLKNVAMGSLKLAVQEKDEALQQNENDLFVHSTVFVLVDKTGKLRGFYESLEPGFQEKISADIQSLLKERP